MDRTDTEITFNEEGLCNHCLDAKKNLPLYTFTKEKESKNLDSLKEKILNQKRGKYDSILGLSGGVDSSYVALLAFRMNLNPLCVHFDNGWNSETAVENIYKIIDKTGFDLETYVINWPEFRDLQRSFFFAGVVDIEMLSDHAIFASMFKIRKKHKIKFVLSGTNYTTEHGMPSSWWWAKMDAKNIKSIQKKFGSKKIKDFPIMNYYKWELMKKFNLGGSFVEILNMINYSKKEAMGSLKKEFDWKYYGGKHFESIFTKFYQLYILPRKFNIDKRKPHLSALIRNEEIAREDAISELALKIDEKSVKFEKEYVLKKLGFSEEDFDEIMNTKPIPHDFYPNSRKNILMIKKIIGKK